MRLQVWSNGEGMHKLWDRTNPSNVWVVWIPMSEPLTREQVEKILDSIVEVYEWRHVINYLWENDAALRQQLEAMTAERDDAVRIATELVGLAPITDADIRWAEALLAAKQHQPGVP